MSVIKSPRPTGFSTLTLQMNHGGGGLWNKKAFNRELFHGIKVFRHVTPKHDKLGGASTYFKVKIL